MRVLFITRKYPPQIGGMEQFSYGLIKYWPEQKSTICLKYSQRHLIWWLPYALCLGIIKSFRADAIHLGDALLAPLGYLLKTITHKPVIITAHGLDITWPKPYYQKTVIPALKKLSKVICVSQSTAQECLKRGISKDKIAVIPNGLDVPAEADATQCHTPLAKVIKIPGKIILLTVGRLVKRKGVDWFVRKVMPLMPKNYEYWIIGAGPEKSNIQASIFKLRLEEQVKLLGRVSDTELQTAYQQADIFIMPNIIVSGDREGFGIVLLEAAAQGLPIVASGIEGIKEAITNGKNGWLVEAGNPEAFKQQIEFLLALPDLVTVQREIREFTIKNYSWENIIKLYQAEIKNPSNSRRQAQE